MPEQSTEDHPPTAARGTTSWVAPLALVIALLAAGAAGWALLRPAPRAAAPTAPAPPQAAGDPKVNACAAYRIVTAAVGLQTHTDLGPDPAAVQAVAANARLAMAGGATYLLARTGPGTPPELASAIGDFARSLQDISMNALAGVTNDDPAQAARLRDAEATNARIADLCK